MTPWEVICLHVDWPKEIRPGVPFNPHPLQIAEINRLGPLPNQGHWHDMGTGKTFITTAIALYWWITYRLPAVGIMPPVLIRQWAKWLAKVKLKSGEPLTIVEYAGTPAERQAKSLDAMFFLVGIQIFKRDYDRIAPHFHGKRIVVFVDEATSIANIGSANYEAVFEFATGNVQIPMTGTPNDPPTNAYALTRLSAPHVYRNFKQFEEKHVDERDHFKKPVKWKALDEMNAALKVNSGRILFSDMYPDAEKPFFNPIEYDLEPEHYKLYRKLSEEQLLELPSGGKVDASTANRLRHALGQIIVNQGHFSGKLDQKSAVLKLLDGRLAELGSGKVVVFAHYRLSVSHVVQQYKHVNAVQINSEVTAKQRDRAKEQFIDDPKCRMIVIQYRSGGLGLDGLQFVCNHAFMIEPIQQPYLVRQSVARLARGGQRLKVLVDLPIAQKTLHVRAFKNLLNNDDVANTIAPTVYELRKEIYGE